MNLFEMKSDVSGSVFHPFGNVGLKSLSLEDIGPPATESLLKRRTDFGLFTRDGVGMDFVATDNMFGFLSSSLAAFKARHVSKSRC
jgi:hypothetical protein